MSALETAATWEDIESLVPWEDNPRMNDAAVPQVQESIRRFGFGAPIVAREADRVVIAGHTRLRAAKLLGLDRVPVRFLPLDPADAKLLALADNKTGETAEWDDGALTDILRGLREDNPEMSLDLGMGWGEGELEALLDGDPFGQGAIYTAKVESPIYEPTGECPDEADLYDTEKRDELLTRIRSVNLPPDVRGFLEAAAWRHTGFRYDRIAEYYAHAPAEVQELMEASALVIMDFDRAVELGFVRLSKDLAEAYKDDHDEG